jgi:hypothetical protein
MKNLRENFLVNRKQGELLGLLPTMSLQLSGSYNFVVETQLYLLVSKFKDVIKILQTVTSCLILLYNHTTQIQNKTDATVPVRTSKAH